MGTVAVLTITALSVGALYFLLASGLALIFGLMNVLSFAHGAYLTAAAYVSWIVLREASVTEGASTSRLILAVAGATAAGALLAYLTEVFLIRPLYSRESLSQILVTAGLALVIEGAIEGIWGSESRAVPIPGWLKDTVEIGGANVTYDRPLIIVLAGIVFVLTEVFLRYTRHGMIVRAGVENREMVRALGVNVGRSSTLVFTIGGAFAGLAGALAAIYGRAVSPDLGPSFLIFAFIVLIVGGLGSLRGALVAAIGLALLQTFANYYIDLGIGDILVIVLMAAVLLLRRQGALEGRAIV